MTTQFKQYESNTIQLVKEFEISTQNIIESLLAYSDREEVCWWQITDRHLFMEFLALGSAEEMFYHMKVVIQEVKEVLEA